LDLSGPGPVEVAGAIGTAAENDVYRFTAAATGTVEVQLWAAAGSPLDTVLSAFDQNGHDVATNDDNGGSFDSLLTFPVTAGKTYFVRASGYGDSTGGYRLRLGPADAP